MTEFRIPEHIQALRPYIAGKPVEELAREKGLTRIIKLASNENPLGASPAAIAAARDALDGVWRYVDPAAHDLIQKLSTVHGRPADQIICGAGTDALLSYMVKALVGPDDSVVTAEGTFIGMYVNVRKHGRKLVTVPLTDYGYDLSRIAEAITPQTRLVYIANANNPTGTYVRTADLAAFMEQVPSDVYVVLDEAYYNYSVHLDDYPNGLDFNYDNLIVTRTLSKDYGLAGLRVGYAIADAQIIREMYKVKLPFEPSLPAQVAAIAALDDHDFVSRTVELNNRMLDIMRQRFDELGMRQVPSAANFILLVLESEAFAYAFTMGCLDRGLILRHVKPFGLPEAVRINTGTVEETNEALNIVADVYTTLQQEGVPAVTAG